VEIEETDMLIEAMKLGDKNAFDCFIQKYHNELYYTALGIVRSEWDARDICQETFIKVFSSLNKLKDTSKIRQWMNRILINKCNDYFRYNKRVAVSNYIEVKSFSGVENVEKIDLLKAILSLKEETRVVLTLRYFQGFPLKEIADILDIPIGTVKSRIYNGLKELRKLMKIDKKGRETL
jgi:RNA polymerase sigma-70 factor (ECF subfamily)